jgi:hypothetical protein
MNKIRSAKNTVVAHKTAILVTALVVTTSVAVLRGSGIKSLNAFLTEHDLYNAYYLPEVE